MSNYNTTLQSYNTGLQAILNTINTLPEAGGDPVLQDKTITPTTSKQIVTADGGYDGLDTVTVNAMPIATQATPNITVNASGLITATAIQTAGYVAAGTKSATKQLAFQPAKTITPGTADQVAVSSGYYTGGAVTVKGDSNLVAGNIAEGVSIFGVTGTHSGGGGVDASQEDGLVARTLTSYTNSRVTTIGSSAFAYYYKLTTVSFPVASKIGISAFAYCSNLTTISFPAATLVGWHAFAHCSKLTTINFPAATTIDNGAFIECKSLINISFPNLITISNGVDGCFNGCNALSSVFLSKVKTIGSKAFIGCSNLTTASFPVATTIGSQVFFNCYKLTTIRFPVVTTIGSMAFAYCSNLTTISFPAVTTIGSYVFRNCTSLRMLYLTGSSLCSLAHSNAFSSAGITSTAGNIYVPSSLVASYKAATNWAYFSNRIFSYTDSGCCFEAGTEVLVSMDGTSKPIETLKEGDSVVTYDVITQENYVAKVKKLIINENTTDIAIVRFDNGTSLTMNAYHPIYTEDGFHSLTNYNDYGTLIVGDKVKTVDGWSEIIEIQRYLSEPIITYNLDIINIDEHPDDNTNDTFYANNIVVHNPSCN